MTESDRQDDDVHSPASYSSGQPMQSSKNASVAASGIGKVFWKPDQGSFLCCNSASHMFLSLWNDAASARVTDILGNQIL